MCVSVLTTSSTHKQIIVSLQQNRLIVDAKVWCSPEPETPTLNAEYSSEGSGKKIKGMTYDIVRAVGDSEHPPPGTAFEENSENSGSDSVPHNDTDPNNADRGDGGSIPLTSQLKHMIKGDRETKDKREKHMIKRDRG
jgi:hypothetical protein